MSDYVNATLRGWFMKNFRHVLKGFLVSAALLCVMKNMAGYAAVDSP